MTISAERREALQKRLDEEIETMDRLQGIVGKMTNAILSWDELHELRTLLHDSARLERIERQVRKLADKLRTEVDGHDPTRSHDEYESGQADKADYIEDQLRAIVDTGRGEGGEG